MAPLAPLLSTPLVWVVKIIAPTHVAAENNIFECLLNDTIVVFGIKSSKITFLVAKRSGDTYVYMINALC